MIDYRWLYAIPIVVFVTGGLIAAWALWFLSIFCILTACILSVCVSKFGLHLHSQQTEYIQIYGQRIKKGKPNYNLIWELQQELYPELVSAGLIEKPKSLEPMNTLVREYADVMKNPFRTMYLPHPERPGPPPPGLALDNYKRPQIHPSHICCKCGAYVSNIYVDMSTYKTYCYKCSPSSELAKFDKYNHRLEIFEEMQEALTTQFGSPS